LFPAGSNWGYCNTNYLLAGMIAEQATGKPFYQLLRDSILVPLQLDSTFLDVYETSPFSVAHPWQAGVNNNAIPRTALNSAAWAAGAMYSTAGEMAQWYNALFNGQLLKESSLDALTTFVGSGNYGIGISRVNVNGRTVWTHGGTIWGGYNSSMMYEPTSGIVICVLINQLPAQAYQVSIQLLSTLINHTVSALIIDPEEKFQFVYPNPTNGIINIDIPNQLIQAVKVYDSQGNFINEATKSQFNLSNYPCGKYWIMAQTNERFFFFPVLKQ
jgi:CubicO group peptidase (beta-lactamase class C family)